MTKAAVYLRVSTTDQDTANQVPALEDLARRLDLEVVAMYHETETAWRSGHQAELARLIDDARRGQFDILLVWALDRLTREGASAILSLVDKLKRYGVKVISYQETWTEAPGDLADILYAIAGWAANMESKRRSERTKAGLVRVKATGKVLGRPAGAKDKRQRSRRGYLLRYAK